MKKFIGSIRTSKQGSECVFEFEIEDDATETEIEEMAREAAFNEVDWCYKEEK